jgi:hypothetical protein
MTASFAAVFFIAVFIAFLRCKERVLRNAIGIGRFLRVISDPGQEERRKDLRLKRREAATLPRVGDPPLSRMG